MSEQKEEQAVSDRGKMKTVTQFCESNQCLNQIDSASKKEENHTIEILSNKREIEILAERTEFKQ